MTSRFEDADRSQVEVTVVLPVHNERGHLRTEVERIAAALDGSRFSYELIVIDDGSTDGCMSELAGMEGLRIVRIPVNTGVGFARKIGTQMARGRVVVWTDADMTYPNELIPALVEELDGHDQVVGARTSEKGSARPLRGPAKWFIRKLASYLVRTRIPDLNSGLRAFRRDVGLQFMHMLPKGFSCVSTITLAFLNNGYSVKYVPIEYSRRRGRSKFHWWHDTKTYILTVLRMVLSFEPLRVFVPVGLALALAGGGKLVYDWTRNDFSLSTNTLLVLFASLQILGIGLVADLMVRSGRSVAEVPPAAMRELDGVPETPEEADERQPAPASVARAHLKDVRAAGQGG